MIQLYHDVSSECSKITTERYSTSFSSAIQLLHKDLHQPIYNIYGFVRLADEIVDSFHEFDKQLLLENFIKETFSAIHNQISLNPILHSFQQVVNQFNIEKELIDAFFASMKADLSKISYNEKEYQEYIYGSAEAVGLMCLHVFCNGDKTVYEKLKPFAQALGAAFQKVNFLRDIKADSENLKRIYFPGIDFNNFTTAMKQNIEEEIEIDFQKAFKGILMLPQKAQFGVYVAYKYYLCLFNKMKSAQPDKLLTERIRIPDYYKALILFKAKLRNQFNILA
jgi:phytoene/squalene synthetase